MCIRTVAPEEPSRTVVDVEVPAPTPRPRDESRSFAAAAWSLAGYMVGPFVRRAEALPL
jgi:hypothetical protein